MLIIDAKDGAYCHQLYQCILLNFVQLITIVGIITGVMLFNTWIDSTLTNAITKNMLAIHLQSLKLSELLLSHNKPAVLQ